MMTEEDFSPILAELKSAESLKELEAYRLAFFGKKGVLTGAMKNLGKMTGADRSAEGARLNGLKERFQDVYAQKKTVLEEAELADALQKTSVDMTLSSVPEASQSGHVHVLSASVHRMVGIFRAMGFALKEGPEIEEESMNFDALNIPPSHPARTQHDTLYLKDSPFLLRTHTSPVQVRTLQQEGAPLRMISAGRVFRDDYDATHTPMFHQIEGLVIQPGIHMGHLKGCLTDFLREFFGQDLKMRFRPNYFPFTEPSCEVDIFSDSLGGMWLEVLGCGMVHPFVLRSMGLDPACHQGFAFGLGAERLTMLKEGLSDLRPFFTGDARWVRHTGRPWLSVAN